MPIRNPQLQPPSGDEGGLMEGFQASDASSWPFKMSFGPVGWRTFWRLEEDFCGFIVTRSKDKSSKELLEHK